jgi:hypothetical protein
MCNGFGRVVRRDKGQGGQVPYLSKSRNEWGEGTNRSCTGDGSVMPEIQDGVSIRPVTPPTRPLDKHALIRPGSE